MAKEYPWTKTFGSVKYGKPSGKKLTRPLVTEIEPPKITKESWFFMTGTLWGCSHIHNERCGERCKCDEERRNTD